jgi:hypothetical protein
MSRRYWTEDRCLEEALKYSTKKHWRISNEASLKAAVDLGIYDKCTRHMPIRKKNPTKYSLEECQRIAKNFSSRQEWKNNHPSSYKCALGQGWYEACVAHMKKLKGEWSTLEKCKEIASRYSTISEWRKQHNSSYAFASKKKWTNDCAAHMKSPTREGSIEKEILNFVKKYYTSSKTARFKVNNIKYYATCFELDIYVPELKAGIEFDGKYWHSNSALRKRFPSWPAQAVSDYHKIKDSFFKSIGISVIHIKEEDWLLDKQAQLNKILKFIGAL